MRTQNGKFKKKMQIATEQNVINLVRIQNEKFEKKMQITREQNVINLMIQN